MFRYFNLRHYRELDRIAEEIREQARRDIRGEVATSRPRARGRTARLNPHKCVPLVAPARGGRFRRTSDPPFWWSRVRGWNGWADATAAPSLASARWDEFAN